MRPAGAGTQAATARGWVLATADEFNGTALGGQWGPYDGEGNGGEGRRDPDAITVQNGIMTIRGDSKGTTGGMAWSGDQRFGKWEVRARFPKGDKQYHPVLLLWPEGKWPDGGEVDFAETTSASSDVSFFLHYSSSNKQKSAEKPLDLTQWHNYAVEWVNGRITGYIDGQQWFQSTESARSRPARCTSPSSSTTSPTAARPSRRRWTSTSFGSTGSCSSARPVPPGAPHRAGRPASPERRRCAR